MEIILVVMIWEMSLALAFIAGQKVKFKRPKRAEAQMSKEAEKSLLRIQKEQENFMTYDGTPQEAINDYE